MKQFQQFAGFSGRVVSPCPPLLARAQGGSRVQRGRLTVICATLKLEWHLNYSKQGIFLGLTRCLGRLAVWTALPHTAL